MYINSGIIASAGVTTSEESGCSSGSMRTSWQISCCQVAVRSQISLCHTKLVFHDDKFYNVYTVTGFTHTHTVTRYILQPPVITETQCISKLLFIEMKSLLLDRKNSELQRSTFRTCQINCGMKEWVQLRVSITILSF